jgi:hypothetical protein
LQLRAGAVSRRCRTAPIPRNSPRRERAC